jgi:hypothetical protein
LYSGPEANEEAEQRRPRPDDQSHQDGQAGEPLPEVGRIRPEVGRIRPELLDDLDRPQPSCPEVVSCLNPVIENVKDPVFIVYGKTSFLV